MTYENYKFWSVEPWQFSILFYYFETSYDELILCFIPRMPSKLGQIGETWTDGNTTQRFRL